MKFPTLDTSYKKACKAATIWRVWQATRRALSLHMVPARRLASCQWQSTARPPLSYLLYRWLLFLSLMCVGLASFVCQSLPARYRGPEVLNRWKWFIYFTNWGFLLVILQAGLSLAVVLRYRTERALAIPCEESDPESEEAPRTPLLCRAYWLTHTVATDLAFVITVIYWSLVYDPAIHDVNAINLLVHGGNSLVMLCELLLTAHPVRAAHAAYGAAAGLLYGMFSALYWAAGGTNRFGRTAIYPALDWDAPGKALGFVAMCAVVLCCAHALATVISILRDKMSTRLRSRGETALPGDKFAPLSSH